MSLAEDMLLAAAESAEESTDHLVIGDDRFVQVPDTKKKLGVQYDHNAETRVFDAPRYSDGRDLSELVFYVNYRRSDGSLGAHACTVPVIDESDESLIHFEWSISRHVMERKGALVFLVCAKAVDDEGNESIHWNSELCSDLYISEGLEVNETLEESYPDIYTQLLEATSTVDEVLERAEAAVAKLDGVEESLKQATETVTAAQTGVEDAANSAAESADNAAASETAAETASESAATKASEAADSADSAAKSAEDAASSADSAAKSAEDAAGSVATLAGYAPIIVGTEELVEGVSPLASGTVYFQIEEVYE